MEDVVPVPLRNGCWKNLDVQWQAAIEADFQHPTSALLQPYLSSHISWSLCVTLTDTFCLMLAHPEAPRPCQCRAAWLGPMLGTGTASSVSTALQNCRQTWSRAAPRQRSCSSIIPTSAFSCQCSCPAPASAPHTPDSCCQWQWKGLWAAGISMVFSKNKHAQDSLYTHGLICWANLVHAFARELCCYCPGKLPISFISYSWLWHTNGSLHNRPQ